MSNDLPLLSALKYGKREFDIDLHGRGLYALEEFGRHFEESIDRRIGNAGLLYIGSAAAMILASWLFLRINSHGWESNRSLAIGIGGGMGFFLLLNVWGIVWRANKKILRWMEATSKNGSPMPLEAATLTRQAMLTSRFSFYLTFVIIFFMAAASHFPIFGV